MRNYDKYKDALADIIIQKYKTDGKDFFKKDILTLDEEENTSDIEDISSEWLLSKWNDKEWENKILSLLVDDVAIDKRKENIKIGICKCLDENMDCDYCALHNVYNWSCGKVLDAWLKDEDNLLLNVRMEETMEEYYNIKSVDEMINLANNKLNNFDSIITYIGILIMGKANEGERSASMNFEECDVVVGKCIMEHLNDLIKILAEQGYEYEITNNQLSIYW